MTTRATEKLTDTANSQPLNEEGKYLLEPREVFKPNKAQLIAFIEERFGDSLRLNLRTGESEMNLPVDIGIMDMELAKTYHLQCHSGDVERAIKYVAFKNQYDPVTTDFEQIEEKADNGDIKPIPINNLSTPYFETTDPLFNEVEEQARNRLNKRFQVTDEWENLIGDYLQEKETNALTLKTEVLVTTKEILKVIGQNPDDRASQNRVSKILQSLKWEKLGQRTINGQRQYVWTYPVLDPSEVKQGVKYRSSTSRG